MIPSTKRPRSAPSTPRSNRRSSTRLRRASVPLFLLVGAVLLGGCTAPGFGMFSGATVQGHDTFKLFSGMAITGIVVAGITYALIMWSALAYRRKRNDSSIPRQFHSNLPIEIIYTVLPVIIVGFIFYFTVLTENNVDAVSNHPAEVVNVLAYRWGWQFTYDDGSGKSQGVMIRTSAQPKLLALPATSPEYPQMVLPEGVPVKIVLTSADVIHGFYVPQFDFSRYAQPGVTNTFEFTPNRTGVFPGQCTQYCGLYHSEMLFSVKVVSNAQFQQWLTATQATQAQGAAS